MAPPTRIERVANGLGTVRDIADAAAQSGENGALRTHCLALLVAAAKGDDAAAESALADLRACLRVDSVSRAVVLAADILNATTSAAVERTG